jgi:hypothetical protein
MKDFCNMTLAERKERETVVIYCIPWETEDGVTGKGRRLA